MTKIKSIETIGACNIFIASISAIFFIRKKHFGLFFIFFQQIHKLEQQQQCYSNKMDSIPIPLYELCHNRRGWQYDSKSLKIIILNTHKQEDR